MRENKTRESGERMRRMKVIRDKIMTEKSWDIGRDNNIIQFNTKQYTHFFLFLFF